MAESLLAALGWGRCKRHLDAYVDPAGEYGWPLYDQDPTPNKLIGVDLVAPALLSYPIRSEHLNQMGSEASVKREAVNEYRAFYEAAREFVEGGGESEFVDLPRVAVVSLSTAASPSEIEGPADWIRFATCLLTVQSTNRFRSVAATKILHRKRPDLVPINDSLVRRFFGLKSGYSKIFLAIHDEISNKDTRANLEDLAARHKGLDGRTMSILRALDIIIWMEMKERTRRSSASD